MDAKMELRQLLYFKNRGKMLDVYCRDLEISLVVFSAPSDEGAVNLVD